MADRRIDSFTNISPTDGDRLLATDDSDSGTHNILVSALSTHIRTGLPTLAGNNTLAGTNTFSTRAVFNGGVTIDGGDGIRLPLNNHTADAEIEAITSGGVPQIRVQLPRSSTASSPTSQLTIRGSGADEGIQLGNNGDLILGSSSGIRFPSGTAGTGVAITSNTLDDYEEGTWTPITDGSNNFTFSNARFIKIGGQVTISADFTITAVTTSILVRTTSLPFTANGGFSGSSRRTTSVGFLGGAGNAFVNSGNCRFEGWGNASIGDTVTGSVTYFTNS